MMAQISNALVREISAERDWLRQRNLALSESLDDTAERYISILARLGFDQEGNPIPKPSVTDETAPIGEPCRVTVARFDDDEFMPPAPKVRD